MCTTLALPVAPAPARSDSSAISPALAQLRRARRRLEASGNRYSACPDDFDDAINLTARQLAAHQLAAAERRLIGLVVAAAGPDLPAAVVVDGSLLVVAPDPNGDDDAPPVLVVVDAPQVATV